MIKRKKIVYRRRNAADSNSIHEARIKAILIEELDSTVDEGFLDSIKGALGMGSSSAKKGISVADMMKKTIAAADPLGPMGQGSVGTGGTAGFKEIDSAMGRGAYAAAGNDAVQDVDTKILEIVGMVEGVYEAASEAAKVAGGGDKATLEYNQAYQNILGEVPADIAKQFQHVEMSTKIYNMTYRRKHVLPYLQKSSPAGIAAAEKARKKAKHIFAINAKYIANQEAGARTRLATSGMGPRRTRHGS